MLAAPSVPTPTAIPASSNAVVRAIPLASFRLDRGQWAKHPYVVLHELDRLLEEFLGRMYVVLQFLHGQLQVVQVLTDQSVLVAQDFHVLVYCSDDPRMCVHLAEAGVTSVMPAGSPIGSGQGILNKNNLGIIIERANVPILVDAGVSPMQLAAAGRYLAASGDVHGNENWRVSMACSVSWRALSAARSPPVAAGATHSAPTRGSPNRRSSSGTPRRSPAARPPGCFCSHDRLEVARNQRVHLLDKSSELA